jgi:hypothetical protein
MDYPNVVSEIARMDMRYRRLVLVTYEVVYTKWPIFILACLSMFFLKRHFKKIDVKKIGVKDFYRKYFNVLYKTRFIHYFSLFFWFYFEAGSWGGGFKGFLEIVFMILMDCTIHTVIFSLVFYSMSTVFFYLLYPLIFRNKIKRRLKMSLFLTLCFSIFYCEYKYKKLLKQEGCLQ